ncbi:OTU domain, ubiquitin aldehyde binding [Blyttiomyces sp. JEL0837]|nr:OTU domain, ubiquitin aldehyde binding [Blyttiomyces sp. JEL0837]
MATTTHAEHADHVNFEENLRKEARLQPLIGEPISFDSLEEEYKLAEDNVKAKVSKLRSDYSGMRRVRKDGNCFYRAFGYRLCERLLEDKEHGRARALSKIEATKKILENVGYDPMITEDFCEPLLDATKSLDDFRNVFETDYSSDAVVCYLRLVTAAVLRLERDAYEAFVLDTYPSLDSFIESQVEPMNIESDQIHIVAMANAFGVRFSIANLDASQNELNYHTINPQNPPEDGTEILIHLLYRPGHYDILL